MAVNDLSFLAERLADAIHRNDDTEWNAEELEDLCIWSVATLYPRISRFASRSDADTITLVSGTYFYPVPVGMRNVVRIDLIDTNGNEAGRLWPRAWEVLGDTLIDDDAELHIGPQIVDSNAGATIRLIGYTQYDTMDHCVPDQFVPLVIAQARAEAYRRLVADRQRYRAWQDLNQTQNVSVNEMLQIVNEADTEAERLRRKYHTLQRPVSGRVG